ncbi:TPX2B protein, partial [Piaya cayana]|nr:TPX2B protein [Piaya cayana]
ARYSFDVPCRYVNFATLGNDDVCNADSWFDQKANVENVSPTENQATVWQNSPALSKSNVIQSSVTSQEITMGKLACHGEETSEAEHMETDVMPQNTGPLTNCRAAAPAEASQRPSRRQATRQRTQQRKQPMRVKVDNSANVLDNKDEVPPLKKMRISSSREKLTEAREPLQNPDLSPGRVKSKLTVPSTPTMLKRTNLTGALKSTEEQELEKIQQLQREVMELRKKNEESLKAAIAGTGQTVKRTVGQVTKPVAFHFCTDDRIKQPVESQSGNEYKEQDFAAVLRKHPPSPGRMPKGPTIPKPFNLSQGNKRKLEETASEYVSLAEQVEAFQKRTPSRYHLRSRKSDEGPVPQKLVKLARTNPKSPMLLTKQRLRPAACKSTAELEAEEIEKIQQYKFKARELNPQIFGGGPLLPKKPPVKELTQPVGFELEIEKRIRERESKKQQEEEHFEFRSRPCPTKILENVV